MYSNQCDCISALSVRLLPHFANIVHLFTTIVKRFARYIIIIIYSKSNLISCIYIIIIYSKSNLISCIYIIIIIYSKSNLISCIYIIIIYSKSNLISCIYIYNHYNI